MHEHDIATESIHTRLARLEARERAREQITGYCSAVDARDEEGLRRLLHSEVVLSRADGDHHGPDGFLDVFRTFWSSDVERSRHHVTNMEVAPWGALDDWRVESYFIVTMEAPRELRVGWGRYLDILTPGQEGELLIRKKQITVERFVKGLHADGDSNPGWER